MKEKINIKETRWFTCIKCGNIFKSTIKLAREGKAKCPSCNKNKK